MNPAQESEIRLKVAVGRMATDSIRVQRRRWWFAVVLAPLAMLVGSVLLSCLIGWWAAVVTAPAGFVMGWWLMGWHLDVRHAELIAKRLWRYPPG